jgi:hypothetical protein
MTLHLLAVAPQKDLYLITEWIDDRVSNRFLRADRFRRWR